MSLPTSALEQLSLENMPTTRAQSQRQERPRPSDHEEEEEEDEDEDEDDDEDQETPQVSGPARVSGPSKVEYDLGGLTQPLVRLIKDAWKSRYTVEKFKEFPPSADSPEVYYAIQIEEPRNYQESVRIKRAEGGSSLVECSCPYYKKKKQPCQHIIWLLDDINKGTEIRRSGPLKFDGQGHLVNGPDPYTLIQRTGGESFAASRHWRLGSTSSDDEQEAGDDTAESVPLSAQKQRVGDIMATFSTKIADEYARELFHGWNGDPLAEDTLVQNNLERTLARVMVFDRNVFERFRSLVPTDDCAIDFFVKSEKEAVSEMRIMDECRPPPRMGPNEFVEIKDVEWCAKRVQAIVDLIHEYANTRKVNLGRRAREQAAKTLVHILENVVDRNVDMYADARWRGTPQQKTPINRHNLFQLVIGQAEALGNPPFILDHLSRLGEAALVRLPVLEDSILVKVRVSNASQLFRSRLEDLVRRLKTDAARHDFRDAPGQKRPGGGSGPGFEQKKRMKSG